MKFTFTANNYVVDKRPLLCFSAMYTFPIHASCSPRGNNSSPFQMCQYQSENADLVVVLAQEIVCFPQWQLTNNWNHKLTLESRCILQLYSFGSAANVSADLESKNP